MRNVSLGEEKEGDSLYFPIFFCKQTSCSYRTDHPESIKRGGGVCVHQNAQTICFPLEKSEQEKAHHHTHPTYSSKSNAILLIYYDYIS